MNQESLGVSPVFSSLLKPCHLAEQLPHRNCEIHISGIRSNVEYGLFLQLKHNEAFRFKITTQEDPELTSSHRHPESAATYKAVSSGEEGNPAKQYLHIS